MLVLLTVVLVRLKARLVSLLLLLHKFLALMMMNVWLFLW